MKRLLRISGIITGAIVVILLFMLIAPMLFREKFAAIVKSTAGKELKTEMNFSEMEVSFFRHFPNLTITLENFTLRSSSPFAKDTLISARDVSFGVNLRSLFSGPIRITRVYIDRGKVVMQYNERGQSSFEVYNSSSESAAKPDTAASEPVAIQIDHIIFIKTDFVYADASIPLEVEVHGINYHGISKVTNDLFRLTSRVNIDSLDVWYNHVRYLKSKPVKANLTTSINMNSLDMKFEKNNLYIKDIPFEFKGEFNFRKDGYSLFLSLFSMFGKEYFSGSVYMISGKNLWVSAKADINLELQTWTRLLGVQDYDVRGLLTMKLNAQGEYITGQDPSTSKPDTVILSIPDFSFSSRLTNGYFRFNQLPQAISEISFGMEASCTNHDYNTINLKLEDLRASFLGNRLEAYCRINGLKDFPIDAHLATRIDLEQIREAIPLDSLELKGLLDVTADVKGNYAPVKHLFPAAQVRLGLQKGFIRTKYYPEPLQNIGITAQVTNSSGNLADTKVAIDTFDFTFAGNPFSLTADLSNPENLVYDIRAKGAIDVAGIYHLFSQEGMDLKGYASMDLRLKGRQSDAIEGRIGKLNNTGQLELRDIAIASEYLPLPLVVKSGIFRFENDNLWFKKFNSSYGASDITMDGHLSNVVNYVLSENQKLKGSFRFTSSYLLVDELMPVEDSSQLAVPSSQPAGVFVVPSNLELELTTDIQKLSYEGLDLHNMTADVEIKEGLLLLKSMKFDVIGCKVAMDATYGSINPKRAFFDFHVKADSFDIKRAYNEIGMIRTLLTSAKNCEGIISLDYSLKGRLNEEMYPIYPSLEGGGVITLAKVKVMGMKLFTSMSRNLEKEELSDPKLSKVELKTTISKNVITLERTKMRIGGFRFRVSGETSFNGQLNLKARLGLPPMGIVGIPMRVLGTQENPKFKYGRGIKDEEVEETDYTDEISPEMLKLIHNAKSTDLKDEPE